MSTHSGEEDWRTDNRFGHFHIGKKGTGKKDLHPESRRVKQAARVELRTKRVTEVGIRSDPLRKRLRS